MKDAANALEQPNYTFNDISSIPNTLGILDENDPDDLAIIKAYDQCKSNQEREALLIKHEAHLTALLRKQTETGQPLKPGQHIMLSKNKVRAGADFTMTVKDPNGKISSRGPSLCIRQELTVPTTGLFTWLLRWALTCRWVAIGGGKSNAFFLDHINSMSTPPTCRSSTSQAHADAVQRRGAERCSLRAVGFRESQGHSLRID